MKRLLYFFIFVLFFLVWVSISIAQTVKGGMGMKEIREPAVSGAFYPNNPDILSRDIRRYLENAKKEKVEGEIVALISPHAGYMYSGPVAAYAYKLIEGKTFDTDRKSVV